MIKSFLGSISKVFLSVWNIEILKKEWWQGVAGITQIIAAILSLLVLWFALRTLIQSKKARKDAIAPAWDITNYRKNMIFCSDKNVYYYNRGVINLKNTGFGPARNINYEFNSLNGYNPKQLRILMRHIKTDAVLQEQELHIRFDWYILKPPVGIIKIKYRNRLSEKEEKKIFINTNLLNDNQEQMDIGSWEINAYFKDTLFNKMYIKLENRKLNIDKDKVKNYYKMEKWLKKHFQFKKDDFRGEITLNKCDQKTPLGKNIGNVVLKLGHIEAPPTREELYTAYSDNKDWQERFDCWEQIGLIKAK